MDEICLETCLSRWNRESQPEVSRSVNEGQPSETEWHGTGMDPEESIPVISSSSNTMAERLGRISLQRRWLLRNSSR